MQSFDATAKQYECNVEPETLESIFVQPMKEQSSATHYQKYSKNGNEVNIFLQLQVLPTP